MKITAFIFLTLIGFITNGQSVNPSTALANFRFEQINYTELDTPTSTLFKAIEHTLYRRYDIAEPLFRQVAQQTNHPLHTVAQSYLFNDFYFLRAKYRELVTFADELQVKPPEYALAKLLADRPQPTVLMEQDSLTLPIQIHRKHHCHVFLTILINGNPRKFMLDTGFTKTAITQKLADELRLPSLPGIEVTNALNRSLSIPTCFIDSLRIGPFNLHNFLAYRLNKGIPGLRFDAVIGWDILQQFSYTIDFKASTLTMRKQTLNATLEKNLFGIIAPFIVVRIEDGQGLNMFYDSGSEDLQVSRNGLQKLSVHTTGRRLRLASSVGQVRLFWDKVLRSYPFTVERYTLTAKKALLTNYENYNLGILQDGMISNKLFKTGRLTIDAVNNHVQYEPK